MLALLILVAIVVLIGFLFIGAYNRLVALRQNVNEAFADIDVQLKQPAGPTVPNLVETVKGYAAHESGTLEAVTAARTAAAGAASVEQRAQAESALTGALDPADRRSPRPIRTLKANQNFMQLQGELADLEEARSPGAPHSSSSSAVGEFNALDPALPGGADRWRDRLHAAGIL